MSFWTWTPRKTSAQRRAEAARLVQAAARRGSAMSPVAVTGRKIAATFWGGAWCDNLERYRDFAYRLERGRSYLRSGSVIDLRIEAGKIIAKVSGSELYDVAIEIDAVAGTAWRAIQRDCAGSIGSRIDLLAGKLSEPVMARLCADRTGLFPAPSAIRFTCSCPDHATMCKHVAAAMYGVGVRLDGAPELLFTLRRVSLDELVASAVSELPATPSAGRVLAAEGLAAMFGIELADPAPAAPASSRKPKAAKPSRAAAPSAPERNTAVANQGPAAAVAVTAPARRARTRAQATALRETSSERRRAPPKQIRVTTSKHTRASTQELAAPPRRTKPMLPTSQTGRGKRGRRT